MGDSTALTLDIGLNEHARDYDIEPFNGGILGCGVTDGAEYQEKGVDAPMAVQCRGAPPRSQWPALWKADIAKDHPNVVMILAGRWEVSNRTYDGHWTNIENPTYAAYVQRAAAVRGAGRRLRRGQRRPDDGPLLRHRRATRRRSRGPRTRGPAWTSTTALSAQVAASIPGTSLLNFNAMACPGGQYEEYMDGQQVRLADGIHFTFTGGNVFAPKIWPFIVKLGRQQMTRTR